MFQWMVSEDRSIIQILAISRRRFDNIYCHLQDLCMKYNRTIKHNETIKYLGERVGVCELSLIHIQMCIRDSSCYVPRNATANIQQNQSKTVIFCISSPIVCTTRCVQSPNHFNFISGLLRAVHNIPNGNHQTFRLCPRRPSKLERKQR